MSTAPVSSPTASILITRGGKWALPRSGSASPIPATTPSRILSISASITLFPTTPRTISSAWTIGIPLARSAESTREKRDMIVIMKMGPKIGTVITNRSIVTRPRSVRLQTTAAAMLPTTTKRNASQ